MAIFCGILKGVKEVKLRIAVKVQLRARGKLTVAEMRQYWRVGGLVVGVAMVSLGLFLMVHAAANSGERGVARKGEIMIDEGIEEDGRNWLTENLAGVELGADVRLGRTEEMRRADAEDRVLYEILVPVADFYAGKMTVSEAEVKAGAWEMIPARELDFKHKLLAIGEEYFLDTFETGAVFQYYTLTGEAEDVAKVQGKLTEKVAETKELPTKETVFSLAQTGVTAMARGMNRRLIQAGKADFATKIGPYLRGFDKTHTSNEASFAEGAPATAGTMTICALPGMKTVLLEIGLDIVELTGNHNQDCGDEMAAETIDWYKQNGIEVFGGGKTAAEAAKALTLAEKGAKVTMLGYNLSTGGYTLDATPGANFYTEEKAQADIAAAKERGDFVIVDVQYYECSAYVSETEDATCDLANSAAGDQIGLFRHLVDLGADLVVGTSAHQPQTFEIYEGKQIYYGLGNLFFDQSWWPGTRRSLILANYFWQGKLVQTRIVPTVYGATYQPERMDFANAEKFVERLVGVRP